jgi:hypothetical protein
MTAGLIRTSFSLMSAVMPEGGEGHLLTHKGDHKPRTFGPAALMPEETPDESEGDDGFVGAGFFAFSGLFRIRRAYFRFL